MLKILAIGTSLVILAVTILTVAVIIKFSNIQRELEALKRALLRKTEAAGPKPNADEQSRQIKQLSLEVDDLRARFAGQEKPTPSQNMWAAETHSIQLNRRGQILRLAAKGKSASEIARDLNVARGEVELLLKVQLLTQSFPEIENAPLVL